MATTENLAGMRPLLLLFLMLVDSMLVFADCCRLVGFSGVPDFDSSAMKLKQTAMLCLFHYLAVTVYS